jgi:hypothetical protein
MISGSAIENQDASMLSGMLKNIHTKFNIISPERLSSCCCISMNNALQFDCSNNLHVFRDFDNGLHCTRVASCFAYLFHIKFCLHLCVVTLLLADNLAEVSCHLANEYTCTRQQLLNEVLCCAKGSSEPTK